MPELELHAQTALRITVIQLLKSEVVFGQVLSKVRTFEYRARRYSPGLDILETQSHR